MRSEPSTLRATPENRNSERARACVCVWGRRTVEYTSTLVIVRHCEAWYYPAAGGVQAYFVLVLATCRPHVKNSRGQRILFCSSMHIVSPCALCIAEVSHVYHACAMYRFWAAVASHVLHLRITHSCIVFAPLLTLAYRIWEHFEITLDARCCRYDFYYVLLLLLNYYYHYYYDVRPLDMIQ